MALHNLLLTPAPHRVNRINVDQNLLRNGLIVKGLFAYLLVLPFRQMRIWIVLSPEFLDFYLVYRLCFNLGMRSSEARHARWSWIEERRNRNGAVVRYMHICRQADWKGPKNTVDHSVPLTEELWIDLQEVRKKQQEKMVGSQSRQPPTEEDPDLHILLPGSTDHARYCLVTREFSAWMRSIGWDRKTYPKAAHELRKLAGSLWYTKSDLKWAAAWLGDSAPTVYHYYADLTEDGPMIDIG